MITQSATCAWARAVTCPASEFAPIALPVIEGQLPLGLRGSLYRNGAARLERSEQRMGHWFDGDGAILAIHFTNEGATGVYRYVQTTGYQAEEAAEKLLFGNYGMTPPGPLWTRFGKSAKNVANTSVLALDDRLLALWEAGHPHCLDLQTLETLGTDALDGLQPKQPYSAHPKRDAQTGEIFNFGVTFGKDAVLHLYRSGQDGRIQQQSAIPLKGVPFIHDFVLAGSYLLFFIAPVRLHTLPVLLNVKSPMEAFVWEPERGTQVLIIDRHTLSPISRNEAEPWFQWHFGNGCVKDGEIVVNLVRYDDFQTNQYLKEVATGQIQTPTQGTLWQMRLNPQSGKVIEMQQASDRGCEFPTVPPTQVGQPWQHTYLVVHRPGAMEKGELFGAIAQYDRQTETLTIADLGENRYVTEPIYAPDCHTSNRGWVLTIVYDGDRDCSEVWAWESDRLDDAPVCKLALPSVIAIGFHGTWHPAGLPNSL
ncbi:MAG: hypothetical protein HC769_02125 [Cyanobacteria bacterium CRU_2_1]|nr:hypothetical protein [Cyanobacteria bacterium RU_5_0]NJR57752.1 hypothetical protein [Cyanobacteria bacterium CRU_2_1]